MAVSIANKGSVIAGNARRRYVDITGPASYTTGGETLSASDLKALTSPTYGTIADILFLQAEPSTGGHELVLDRANSKIKYFNGTTEIAGAVNLSTIVNRTEVVFGAVNK